MRFVPRSGSRTFAFALWSILILSTSRSAFAQTTEMHFEANEGQSDARVKFLARGRNYSVHLTANEAVIAWRDGVGSDRSVLRMRPVDGRPRPIVEGMNRLRGTVNYCIGNDPATWRTNIPTYGAVKYRDVYPGVDLVFYGDGAELEYDFIVAPGVNPNTIALALDGADRLTEDPSGDLVMQIGGREIHQRKPSVYQEVDGTRREVSAFWRLKEKDRVGFRLGAYDRSKPLVIDPVFTYSTYLGGNSTDIGFAVAADSWGNSYVAGYTVSDDFAGGGTHPHPGDIDAFVAAYDWFGSRRFVTYLGGSGYDIARAITTSWLGYLYVAGDTEASNYYDAFVTKIDTNNTSADLSITASVSPDPVNVLGTATYTITVTNDGPAMASGVVVSYNGSAGQSIGYPNPSSGWCNTSGLSGSCNVVALAAGASVTITIDATPTDVGSISLTAAVTASEPDPTTPNSVTTATTVM